MCVQEGGAQTDEAICFVCANAGMGKHAAHKRDAPGCKYYGVLAGKRKMKQGGPATLSRATVHVEPERRGELPPPPAPAGGERVRTLCVAPTFRGEQCATTDR